jgi:hypothetical protein
MSLAVAIEASDGIVFGADSRATYGDPRGFTAVDGQLLVSQVASDSKVVS